MCGKTSRLDRLGARTPPCLRGCLSASGLNGHLQESLSFGLILVASSSSTSALCNKGVGCACLHDLYPFGGILS
ncbi:hypothetical protein BDQ94DRAFT_139944 [Aspergillus welwitschiae]|uniref:Uncharacterized protein n=1 Tax=Aspergillus welwitschiae TaxID=1341132 RepID=A0A3F3Q8Y4_9EURO|nr:hypothetical protein BDQ94DRAFT_139944 [Aspergillus welwitschiae]RDH35623.1 hypothetical protein BDQ94DRAFT_139944 [Aspergillus welwitschiae]